MEKAEALRSIRYDLVEYIQKKIRVEFDSIRQAPVSFSFAGTSHAIGKVMGRFRTRKEYPLNAFLVDAGNDEVYFLIFISTTGINIGHLMRAIGFFVFEFSATMS